MESNLFYVINLHEKYINHFTTHEEAEKFISEQLDEGIDKSDLLVIYGKEMHIRHQLYLMGDDE